MTPRRMWGLALPVAAMLATCAFSSPASAATQSFGCRASVARVAVLDGSLLTVEPYVADPSASPCASDTAGITTGTALGSGGVLTGLLGGALNVGPAEAVTTSVADATDLGASSMVAVSGLSIPTPAGAITAAGPIQVTAGYSCVNQQVVAQSGSNLTVLTVGSQTITLPTAGAADTIPLNNVLGLNIGSISLNENTQTATSNTEDLLDIHLNGLADIVVGEAQVTRPAANPCAGVPATGPTGPGGPGSPGSPSGPGSPGSPGLPGAPGSTANGCPAGTTLDPSTSKCVLTTGTGPGSKTIAVSSVNSGDIVGGKVITLAQARKHYSKARCLRGGGPAFVVVGSRGRNRITVKAKRYRVLGLSGNDRVTVKSGSGTCVDAGGGNDRIVYRGAKRAFAYGSSGNDHIVLGNGPALVRGGSGDDTITAGNGRLTVYGGVGADVIKVGTGHDTIIGDKGNNRITARGRFAHVSAGKGKSVAFLRKPNRAYAHRHGVKTVKPIG